MYVKGEPGGFKLVRDEQNDDFNPLENLYYELKPILFGALAYSAFLNSENSSLIKISSFILSVAVLIIVYSRLKSRGYID